MDYIACVYRLRSDVTWDQEMVNGYSLETIEETYQSEDPIPTEQECIDIWDTIDTELRIIEQNSVDIKIEQESAGLKNITIEQAKEIIKNRYDIIRSLPIAGGDNIETINNIETVISNMIDTCEWVNQKMVVYLLK